MPLSAPGPGYLLQGGCRAEPAGPVRTRPGRQYSARFDSFTFHAFAKRLIDNYRPFLTGVNELRPDYRLDPDTRVHGEQITFDWCLWHSSTGPVRVTSTTSPGAGWYWSVLARAGRATTWRLVIDETNPVVGIYSDFTTTADVRKAISQGWPLLANIAVFRAPAGCTAPWTKPAPARAKVDSDYQVEQVLSKQATDHPAWISYWTPEIPPVGTDLFDAGRRPARPPRPTSPALPALS